MTNKNAGFCVKKYAYLRSQNESPKFDKLKSVQFEHLASSASAIPVFLVRFSVFFPKTEISDIKNRDCGSTAVKMVKLNTF